MCVCVCGGVGVWVCVPIIPRGNLCGADQVEELRPRGGAPLCWFDMINNDLRGMTNWTEVIQRPSRVASYHLSAPTNLELSPSDNNKHADPTNCPQWTYGE